MPDRIELNFFFFFFLRVFFAFTTEGFCSDLVTLWIIARDADVIDTETSGLFLVVMAVVGVAEIVFVATVEAAKAELLLEGSFGIGVVEAVTLTAAAATGFGEQQEGSLVELVVASGRGGGAGAAEAPCWCSAESIILWIGGNIIMVMKLVSFLRLVRGLFQQTEIAGMLYSVILLC